MFNGKRPVILMRPGAANERLAEAFAGTDALLWKWPAFSILPPSDIERVQIRLNDLECFDMVLFASPTAVMSIAAYVRKWPSHITLATIGAGTAQAIRQAWGCDNEIVYPDGETMQSGSEALFELLKNRGFPARVLIIRGQVGREWLKEQLMAHGTDVEVLEAYQRVPLELTCQQLMSLQVSLLGPKPIVYLTSTDAVSSLLHAVKGVRGAREWLTEGTVLTIHPRPMACLKDAGFRDVELVSATDSKVKEKVLEILAR